MVMAAMMSVRLPVCAEELASRLSQPGSLLIAMAPGQVGAVQEQVAGTVSGSAHQHQRDLCQPWVAIFRVSPELEKQMERGCELSWTQLNNTHPSQQTPAVDFLPPFKRLIYSLKNL